MPDVAATGFTAAGAFTVAFGVGLRTAVGREGAAEGRAATVRTGAGSLGAGGAFWSLVGTAGP